MQLWLKYAKLNGFGTARLKTRASKLSDAVEMGSLTGGLNGFIRDSNPLWRLHSNYWLSVWRRGCINT